MPGCLGLQRRPFGLGFLHAVSPNTRWPAAITGSMTSGRKGLGYHNQRHFGRIAGGNRGRPSAIAARTAARPDGFGEADVAMMINTILPDIH